MQMLYLLALAMVMSVFALPSAADAARIYLDTGLSQYNRLDTFYAPIRLDTQGACVNAVSVEIKYDPSELSVVDVARGSSILTLWTQTPEIDKAAGTVHFEGGIPGGFCGRIEGDPGLTTILAELVLTGVPQALEAGDRSSTILSVTDNSHVYLNDGAATEAPLEMGKSLVTLFVATSSPNNAWIADVHADTVAPELFDIILAQNPAVASNRWFIAFSTVDKQSGLDHYEVLETDPDRFGFLTWLPRESHWVVATSPYVLRDQQLRSKIMVKALDKNGNERIVTYTPPLSPLVEVFRPEVLIILILLCVLIIGLVLFARRKQRRVDTEDVPENHEDL